MSTLILVHQPGKQDRADYEDIARRLQGRGIGVCIVDTNEHP